MSSPADATADLGLLLLSAFRGTFVGTQALGLLMLHLLDGPGTGGMGLRRVQWQCNAGNKASVRKAERMGMRMEATVRWKEVLPWGKVGAEGEGVPRGVGVGRESGSGEEAGQGWGPGRHTAVLAICWDDWREGGRDHVVRLMEK
jgi:hypothetical protein